jgi:hypothetical protein
VESFPTRTAEAAGWDDIRRNSEKLSVGWMSERNAITRWFETGGEIGKRTGDDRLETLPR